jgi:hypothetical protein
LKTPLPIGVAASNRSAARQGFRARSLAAMLAFGGIGPLILLVAPVVAAQLGLIASQVDTYFFVELGPFGFANMPSYLCFGRANAQRVGLIAVVAYCAGNVVTADLMPGFMALLALHVFPGLGAGTLLVSSLASAASSGNRDRPDICSAGGEPTRRGGCRPVSAAMPF